jgi:hypothetical protein
VEVMDNLHFNVYLKIQSAFPQRGVALLEVCVWHIPYESASLNLCYLHFHGFLHVWFSARKSISTPSVEILKHW